jgi:hypothetical protein
MRCGVPDQQKRLKITTRAIMSPGTTPHDPATAPLPGRSWQTHTPRAGAVEATTTPWGEPSSMSKVPGHGHVLPPEDRDSLEDRGHQGPTRKPPVATSRVAMASPGPKPVPRGERRGPSEEHHATGGNSYPDGGRDGMIARQQRGLKTTPLVPEPQVAGQELGPRVPRPQLDQGTPRMQGKPRQA